MQNKRLQTITCYAGLILSIPAAFLATGCGKADAVQPRITKAEMGLGKTDNDEVVNPSSKFAADTAKIYCVWKAEGLKAGDVLRGAWIAEDVGASAPPNYKIDEATLNLPMAYNQGSFDVSKPTAGWPVGKYRLEIYLGKDLAKTVPFSIE